MQITFDSTKNRYYLDCTFDERKIAKEYKFKWCSEENRWFTDNWYNAFKLYPRTSHYLLALNNYVLNKKFSDSKEFSKNTLRDLNGFEFQQRGTYEIIERGSVLLADEQGLGKTMQAIGAIDVEWWAKTVIICPSTLKINWAREFLEWTEIHENSIQIVRTGKDIIDQKKPVIIVNYDLLKSHFIFDQLNEYDAVTVVLDEVHYLKSYKAIRTKIALKLAKKAIRVIAISGTPVLNRPIELFPLLNAIFPQTIAPYNDLYKFAYHFCNAYTDNYGRLNMDGASNLEELNIRLRATCMIRRLKKDVLDQFPEKMPPQIIAFEQNKETKAIIKKEETLNIEELKRSPEKMNIGDAAKFRHELARAKLPSCIEFIEERLLAEEKIVIFAYHRDVANQLFDALKKYGAVDLVGGMSDSCKQDAVDKFQTDPKTRIFIGQIQAAGVGITLTAASEVIFVETSWTPGDIDQCVDRCHRIGQKNSVLTFFLTVEKSLEETMLKVVYDKRKNINKILK